VKETQAIKPAAKREKNENAFTKKKFKTKAG
jgi:hypothetical protein